MRTSHFYSFLFNLLLCFILIVGWTKNSQSKEVQSPEASTPSLDMMKCKHSWPGLNLTYTKALIYLKMGQLEVEKAGEHPTESAVARIIRSLSQAAEFGLSDAQFKLGFYVVGYWMTDEMFWPSQKDRAIHALAMLRVAALHMSDVKKSKTQDPFLKALSMPSPHFGDETYALPKEWLNRSLNLANEWIKCMQLIKTRKKSH